MNSYVLYFTNVNIYSVTYVINILLTFVKLMFTIMKDRLQRFLELEQLTPSRLADILGIQRSGLSHILSGRNKPGFDFIQKLIVKFPSVNADWLLTGKGKVYKESTSAPLSSTVGNLYPKESRFFNPESENTNIPYSENTSETTSNQHIKPILNQPELSEISINDFNQAIHSEKKNLKKIIMIYSDGTFTEYIPGKE